MFKLDQASEKSILNMLLDNKLINKEQIDRINTVSSEGGKSKIETALELEFTTEDKILEVLSKSYSLPIVELKNYSLDDKLKNIIPINYIKENFMVPFEISGNTLKIAISDASKLSLMKNIKTITQMNPELYAASISDTNNFINGITKSENKNNIKKASTTEKKIKKENYDEIEDDSEVVKFVNNVIAQAIIQGASDVHIEPYKHSSRIRYRIDGILRSIDEYSKFLDQNYSHVVTRIKIISGLDIAEKRQTQDGSSTFKNQGIEIDLRVSVLPTKHDERVVMRILNKEAGEKNLDELGFEKNDLAKLKKAIFSPQGMVLVTGPTGSGKTTTLYSILKAISKPSVNILTAEDPVEFDLEGIGQVQINEEIEFTFEKALRSFLRQDPEVILIGEMRDNVTVETALKASLTGHLVFSTLHTNNALGSIIRLLDLGTPNYLISSALTLVIAQRLVRRLCPDCKEIDENITQNPKLLTSIGIDFSQSSRARIYKHKNQGCEKCKHSGHKGRVAIYEILEIDKSLKQGILSGVSQNELENIAKKNEFKTMQQMGHELLLSGILSYDEYSRQVQSGELSLEEYDKQENV